MGFAEPAVAPDLDSPNSHMCPGKELGLAMCRAFLTAFARSAHGKGPVAAVSRPVAGGGPDPINMVGPTNFTLEKVG